MLGQTLRDGIIAREKIENIDIDAEPKNPDDSKRTKNREQEMSRGLHAAEEFSNRKPAVTWNQ